MIMPTHVFEDAPHGVWPGVVEEQYRDPATVDQLS
jgi:hypothetical protein